MSNGQVGKAILLTGAIALLVIAAARSQRGEIVYTATFFVTDSETQEPVSSAMVTLSGATAMTNSEGVCAIEIARPGTYGYTIECGGYATASGNVSI